MKTATEARRQSTIPTTEQCWRLTFCLIHKQTSLVSPPRHTHIYKKEKRWEEDSLHALRCGEKARVEQEEQRAAQRRSSQSPGDPEELHAGAQAAQRRRCPVRLLPIQAAIRREGKQAQSVRALQKESHPSAHPGSTHSSAAQSPNRSSKTGCPDLVAGLDSMFPS
ncbi:hypothetical protein SRHO_G00004710 [Serrasalmus rhombeus]